MSVSLKKNVANIQLPLIFNGKTLENVTSHKHLGIELNCTLSWKEHIASISSAANKKVGILACLKHILDRKTLTTMYMSFIRPSLEYGNVIWCNCNSAENDILESIQKRALRIITGAIIRTPTNCIYEEAGIETLKVRRERNVLIYFHKIVNGLVPNYLNELKPLSTRRERYGLRRQLNFLAPRCRISKYQKSFLPLAVSLWNNLDDSIKCITDSLAFKTVLCPKLIDNPLNLIGNRVDQIIMAKLRLNCSSLKSHLFNLNIIDSQTCACGYNKENSIHFFLICPLYNGPRVTLHDNVVGIAAFTPKTLLYGSKELSFESNSKIIKATLTFIHQTKRFED